MRRKKYTAEHIKFIREMSTIKSDSEAYAEFIHVFGTVITKEGYRKLRQRLGINKRGWYGNPTSLPETNPE